MRTFPAILLSAALLICLNPLPVIGAEPAASDSADTATQYLMAWSFKDYPTMYRLSSPETRKAMSEQAFYSAAAAVPSPLGDAKIVSRSKSPAGGETLYLQYAVAGTETPTRTSVILQPGGITHADLLGHAVAAAPPTAAGPTGGPVGVGLAQLPATADQAASQTVDGLTADVILTKMQKATEAAETLKADLVLHGSMMGETLNETGKVIFRAPNQIRVDSPKFVLNGDGQKTTLYMPQLNSYMDLGSMGDLELTPGLGTPVSELRQKYNVSLIGKSDIDGVPTYQLNLKPPSTGDVSLGAMMGGIGGGAMRLWVSSVTWMPVRAKISSITADYKNLQINAGGIDEHSFVFSAPVGAQELNLGSLLGGLSAGKSTGE